MTVSQGQVLLYLIQGVEGEAWVSDRVGWDLNFNEGVCSWEGIICDPADQITVTGIKLAGKGLKAIIPSELGLMTTLREISLPENELRGTLPTEIAALPHLEIINLSKNLITGTLPTFTSPTLLSVNLSNNELAGTLPGDIARRHSRLTDFDVLHNQLTGSIPDSFANIESLQMLSLSENGFSGTIPPTLGTARVLRYLFLDDNNLMGSIPSGLARINSPLAELWLQENLLSGTVPPTIADLDELFNFYIDGNKFTGTIPQELCRSDLNKDFFENVADDVERNYCDSVACPVGHVSFEGIFPCEPCEKKFFNPYLGRVGECIDLNQRDILEALKESTRGDEWKTMTVPWETDNDYYCAFTGVTCDKNKNVIALDLKGMNLRGRIPEEVGFLRYLERLDLSDNYLTGFLPSDLRWAPLGQLDISGNQFKGTVPPLLCLKGGINGNGEQGEFDCEHIACPVGTYSSIGIGVVQNDEKCIPCESALYLGSKMCPISEETGSTVHTKGKSHSNGAILEKDLGASTGSGASTNGGAIAGAILGSFLTVVVVAYVSLLIYRHKKKTRGELVPQEPDLDDFSPPKLEFN